MRRRERHGVGLRGRWTTVENLGLSKSQFSLCICATCVLGETAFSHPALTIPLRLCTWDLALPCSLASSLRSSAPLGLHRRRTTNSERLCESIIVLIANLFLVKVNILIVHFTNFDKDSSDRRACVLSCDERAQKCGIVAHYCKRRS